MPVQTAVLFVRPRGWHLLEKHMSVDRQPVPAAIFDFALFFFHNAAELLRRGSGPYFYLPKMQSHLEARLWNDVFVEAQAELGIPRGSIRVSNLVVGSCLIVGSKQGPGLHWDEQVGCAVECGTL